MPDAELHVWFGWALVLVGLLPLPFMVRGIVTFLRETARVDRGDAGWLARWPIAIFTGRFRRHEGHFDPGQRLANVAIVVLLGVLVATGVALTTIKSGPTFAVLDTVHRLSTYAFTLLIVGHIVIGFGILPGYRGVWRSMHLGGRVPMAVSRRLWPGWTERRIRERAGTSEPVPPERVVPGRDGRVRSGGSGS